MFKGRLGGAQAFCQGLWLLCGNNMSGYGTIKGVAGVGGKSTV